MISVTITAKFAGHTQQYVSYGTADVQTDIRAKWWYGLSVQALPA